MKAMTATEAARLLLLSIAHVTELARIGEIKAVKVGRAWQFDEADVLRWKAERPSRKPQDHPWRHGMVLGRQNWRCRVCSTLNTRRKVCSKCGAVKKGTSDGDEQKRKAATGRRD